MSFETPRVLESHEGTQPTSDELGSLHADFLATASKRGFTEPASILPNPDGTVPLRFCLDLSRAPQEELRVILGGETDLIGLRVDIAEPHSIDPEISGLVESTFVSWTTHEDDGSVAEHCYFIRRDQAYSMEWSAEYEKIDSDETRRPITHEEFSQLRLLMSYIEYAALCGHLKRS